MSNNANITDDDIRTRAAKPTEQDDDRDTGTSEGKDTGDEPTEADENLDQGGEGPRDTGDEA